METKTKTATITDAKLLAAAAFLAGAAGFALLTTSGNKYAGGGVPGAPNVSGGGVPGAPNVSGGGVPGIPRNVEGGGVPGRTLEGGGVPGRQ